MRIYHLDEYSSDVYYINDVELTPSKFRKNIKSIKAYIQVHSGDVLTIVSLKSQVRGYGTRLMIHVMKLYSLLGLRIIELDDCSDRQRQKNNIYVKLGLTYVCDHGPEMEGDIIDCLEMISSAT